MNLVQDILDTLDYGVQPDSQTMVLLLEAKKVPTDETQQESLAGVSKVYPCHVQ